MFSTKIPILFNGKMVTDFKLQGDCKSDLANLEHTEILTDRWIQEQSYAHACFTEVNRETYTSGKSGMHGCKFKPCIKISLCNSIFHFSSPLLLPSYFTLCTILNLRKDSNSCPWMRPTVLWNKAHAVSTHSKRHWI